MDDESFLKNMITINVNTNIKLVGIHIGYFVGVVDNALCLLK